MPGQAATQPHCTAELPPLPVSPSDSCHGNAADLVPATRDCLQTQTSSLHNGRTLLLLLQGGYCPVSAKAAHRATYDGGDSLQHPKVT